MSENIVSIDADAPIRKAKEIFNKKGFHHLLVLENEKLFGVISDRDLLKAISPNVDSPAATEKDLATLNKKAHQIMSRNPICLYEHDTAKDAVLLFNAHKISCIPVINEERKPVGIVTWRDIIRYIASKIE